MAQVESGQLLSPGAADSQAAQQSLWRRWFGQGNGAAASETVNTGTEVQQQNEEEQRPGLIRRVSRKVVPGLPRAQTFRRRISEVRNNLEPFAPTPAERRAVSMDRRHHTAQNIGNFSSNPRSSAPDFIRNEVFNSTVFAPSVAGSVDEEKILDNVGESAVPKELLGELPQAPEAEAGTFDDAASMTTSQYDNMIHEELERIWILNLSMHFRDKSKREKFFVTYHEKGLHWRRVTISLDYRGAPDNSLEMDLLQTKFQRDKSAKIYEAIRESLIDIQFYDTVTNLKLQTTDGRLHVHVVEDANETIAYPTAWMIQHLRCKRVRESDIDFESHMSGFVYKVRVNGETLIKKEIPGPDTVDEFLYEINALNQLRNSRNVIRFYGVVVDDHGEHVKGLLISYAEQGALIDVIYDYNHGLPWTRREKWARQIVEGLSEIHEAGFVQGDFTLSNIVVDHNDNAKIIDINRRGCPVGWEPPEATPLIESNQRISMYIGVKSDLYQLGMVLWALAEQEDEPEAHGRPLTLGEDGDLPHWYKAVVRFCLAESPQHRLAATELLRLFPAPQEADLNISPALQPAISVDDGFSVQQFLVNERETGDGPTIKTVQVPSDWNYGNNFRHTYIETSTASSNEPYYYPTRGRSPPSPMPSNLDYYEPRWVHQGGFLGFPKSPSFERKRSSPGFDFAPDSVIPNNHVNGTTALAPRVQDEAQAFESEAKNQEVAHLETAKDDSGTPRQDRSGSLIQDAEKLSEEVALAAEAAEAAEGLTGQPGEIEAAAEEIHKPVEPSPEAGHQENTDTQDAASIIMGNGVQDFFESNSTSQNPLFQEAGTTEPEAPRTIALVPRAAEIQKTKSASTVLDTRQGWECERVDSAIEMSSPSSLPELWLGTNLHDDLLCLGSGHDDSDDDVIRTGSADAITDDDQLTLLSAC